MTTELRVNTTTATYPVRIGRGLLQRLGDELRALGLAEGTRVFIVTDEHLHAHGYTDTALRACERAGFTAAARIIPPSDESKSLRVAERIYTAMVDAGMRRHDVVIALGGGVVGDLAGFVAATYYRGVPYVQVPTTLLAHDSAIGGKVGVNLGQGKNLVGAFHHPLAVLFDVDTLQSLPVREWRAGMAEVIKHALIGDADLFFELAARPLPDPATPECAEQLIARASTVKIRIVEADEREQGARMMLNLGHTIGHAIEHLTAYRINHGEAVAIGIRVESELAVALGLLTTDEKDLISRILAQHQLPVDPPHLPWQDVAEVLNVDKKRGPAGWTFALPNGIGRVQVVSGIDPAGVQQVWKRLNASGNRECES